MDKSYEFKRKSLYWYSVLKNDPDSVNQYYSDETPVDRYSVISSMLFKRLICLESLLAPYKIINDEHSSKPSTYGKLSLPKNVNLNTFIRAKRLLFNEIGIDSIVHDTKVIGELINQMEDTLDSNKSSNIQSKAMRQHKEGINSCLKYIFQIVKDDVQNYQRLKLKFESAINNNLKVMTENLSEVRNLDSSKSFDSIPNAYLSHFISSDKLSQQNILHTDHSMSKGSSDKSGYSCADSNMDEKNSSIGQHSQHQPSSSFQLTPLMPGSDPSNNLNSSSTPGLHPNRPSKHTPGTNKGYPNITGFNYGSLNFNKGVYNISSNHIDSSEMEDRQVTDTLIQQHSRTVNSINDQIKANELLAINSVQERLTEISSMFVKLTGTVEQQNELHQIINANVQESISNIEKTQNTLKKTSKESLPFYHRILCIALVGLSLFLLFIDYLNSAKGSYLI